MKRIVVVAAAAALALGAATESRAVKFDLTGQGGTAPDSVVIEFDTFDWGVSGALIQGGIPVQQGGKHTIYTHATLSAFKLGGANVDTSAFGTLDTDFEVTVVLGFGEVTSFVAGSVATFAFDQTNPVNFFEIYLDTDSTTFADLSLDDGDASGTGTHDGTLILSGRINSASGVFSLTSNSTTNLDSHGVDSLSGQQSVQGTGSTSLTAGVANVNINHNYFLDIPASLSFVLSDTSNNFLPFTQGDPQTTFWSGSSDLVMGTDWDVGTVNGLSGPDMTIQTDGSTYVRVVPEPGTMVLLGSGLLGLAGATRRGRKT